MTSNIPGDPSFQFLSGASGGSPTIEITATSSGTAQTIHTASSGVDDVDYVTIWAVNIDGSANYNVTLEIDGQTVGPLQVSRLSAPFKILDAIPVNDAIDIKAFASGASKVVLMGKVVTIVEGAA